MSNISVSMTYFRSGSILYTMIRSSYFCLLWLFLVIGFGFKSNLLIFLCNTVVKSFFKILNFSASSTLSVKDTKYQGFSVVFGNLEIGSKYRTGSNQYYIMIWEMSGIFPFETCSDIF
jgi:hypothetical protein